MTEIPPSLRPASGLPSGKHTIPAGPSSPVSWARFREVLAGACGVDPGTVSADTPLREVAETKLERAVIFTTIAKMGFGLERPYFDAAETFGDLWEWVRQRRIGTADTDDLRIPPEGAPIESPVWLRPLRQADVPLLYEAAQSPRSAFRWRFRGPFPSPASFAELLYGGVLVQFVVEEKEQGAAQGLVVAYDASPENGTCFLAFQRFGRSVGGGEMFIGMFHFVEYVWRRWNMRKLYAEVPGYSLSHVGDGFDVMTEEARLRDFDYYDGRFWDRVFFSIDKATWEKRAEVWRPYLLEGLAPDAR